MSVRDLNKCIIVTDALNGEIITIIDRGLYDDNIITLLIGEIFQRDLQNEHGLIIKFGYKN